MSRLKILFIAGWYPTKENPINGIFVREHAKATFLYNDVVVVHSLGRDRSLRGPYKLFDSIEDGIRTIRVKYRISPIPKTTYLIYLWSMISIFRKLVKDGFKPNIIHINIYSAAMPWIIIGKVYGIPIIITEHFTEILKMELKGFKKIQLKLIMNRADMVLPVSESLKKALGEYGVKTKINVIPNTVDVKAFNSPLSTPGAENKRKKFLFIGFLNPRKGVSYLLEALSIVKQKRSDFALDILGDGPERDKLKQLASKLGLQGIVKFHGFVNQATKVDLLKRSVFFVLPSSWENFGVVLIEAMACGKPVIATARGGPREIVTREVGILAPPEDVNALADAIDYMLDHHAEYSSEAIARYACARFSLQAVGRALNDIYRELVSGSER